MKEPNEIDIWVRLRLRIGADWFGDHDASKSTLSERGRWSRITTVPAVGTMFYPKVAPPV